MRSIAGSRGSGRLITSASACRFSTLARSAREDGRQPGVGLEAEGLNRAVLGAAEVLEDEGFPRLPGASKDQRLATRPPLPRVQLALKIAVHGVSSLQKSPNHAGFWRESNPGIKSGTGADSAHPNVADWVWRLSAIYRGPAREIPSRG